MSESAKQLTKDQFISPTARYYGEFTPKQLAFNSNLQEFASRVSIVCGLETGGKISSQDAYDQIKQLWKQLKDSKRELLDSDEHLEIDLPDD